MKTNFIKNVKQFLFLLVALLGTFIGLAQSTSTIGGSKTPGDIGGLVNPNDTGGKTPGGIGLIALTPDNPTDIGWLGSGGKGTSGDTGQYSDIGGGKSSDGGVLLGLADTGGNHTTSTDIGGRNDTSTGGNFCDIGGRGTSSDTGQVDDDDSDPFDIGSNGGVIIGRPAIGGRDSGGGFLTCVDTGGRNGTGTSSGGDLDSDIGGGKGSSDPYWADSFYDV